MTGPIADVAPVQMDHRARMEILGAILLTMFLSALDQTIVGTALPRIVTDLNGNALYVWVVTVYLLAATITGPIYGKLSDLFGRRPIMMIGVSLFLIGSLLCGLSQEMWQLILFRGIQGLGAGAIFPISLAVIGDLFSPRERGRYQGLFGGVFSLASIIGPALGGFLTDSLSWHWVFLVNLPLGIVALFVLWRLLPPIRHPERVISIDYLGAAVFAAALVPLLIGLTNKQFSEWSDPFVGGLIALGLLLSAVFVWVESRAAEPILPLELFRNRTVTGSIIGTFLITFGFFGAIIFIPRWFQSVLGSSATESGYQMLPLMVGVIGSSIGSGLIVARTGRYKWMTVGAIATSAIGLYFMTGIRAETPVAWSGSGCSSPASASGRHSRSSRRSCRAPSRPACSVPPPAPSPSSDRSADRSGWRSPARSSAARSAPRSRDSSLRTECRNRSSMASPPPARTARRT